MIDGISINAELSGANHFYLNMPIENIERIEVIRGPASALYGSFAHIGLINVITKSASHKDGSFFLRASSQDSKTIGFTKNINSENLKVAISGSFIKNDNSREYNSYSLLSEEAPFTSYENFSSKSLAVSIELLKDISVTSRYLEHITQNYFGYGAWPIAKDPKELTHSSFINEIAYTPELTQTLSLDIRVGYKEYSMRGLSRLHPYSIQEPSSSYPRYDLLGDGDYSEQTLYSDISLNYIFALHNLTLGLYLASTQADGSSYSINDPSLSEATTIAIEGGGLMQSMHREHYALYLSDIYNFSENWATNIALRYDEYSNSENSYSPKFSLLYTQDEKQSYKLIYQHSFRAPTFIELYGTQAPFVGDTKLKSETIDTFELAYRYESGFERWYGINFFYSQMQDFIYRDSSFKFKNGLETISYGAELELKSPLSQSITLQANYSYAYTEDAQSQESALVANHLANFMLSYQIYRDWHTGTHIRAVGSRSREEGDSRAALKGYTTFNQTLTYTHDALSIQASVKNLFDQEIIYSAPMGDDMTNTNKPSSGTYMEDLMQDGRTFWLTLEWMF